MVPSTGTVRNRTITTTCLAALTVVLTTGAACEPLPAKPKSGSSSSGSTAAIPADYRALYKASGSRCRGIDWAVLAAIGKIETNHGRSPLPGVRSGANGSGASGPMQFVGATWRAVRKRHPEIGRDVYNPAHAIPAAAALLCDNGASKNLRNAIFSYNHANWYVNQVLAQAKEYR